MLRTILFLSLIFFSSGLRASASGMLYQLCSMMARNIQNTVELESKTWWHPSNVKNPQIHIILVYDINPYGYSADESESGLSFEVKLDYTDEKNVRRHKTLKKILIESFDVDPRNIDFHQTATESLIAADILYGHQDSLVQYLRNHQSLRNPDYRPIITNYFSDNLIPKKPFLDFVLKAVNKKNFPRVNNLMDVDTLVELCLNSFLQILSRKSRKISVALHFNNQLLEAVPEDLQELFPYTSRAYDIKLKLNLVRDPFLHDFILRFDQDEIDSLLRSSVGEATTLITNKIISTLNFEANINKYIRNELGLVRLFTENGKDGCSTTFE